MCLCPPPPPPPSPAFSNANHAVYRLVTTPCSLEGFDSPDNHPQLFYVATSTNPSIPGVHLVPGFADTNGYGPICVQSCDNCGVTYSQGVGAMVGVCWATEDWEEAQRIDNRDTFRLDRAPGGRGGAWRRRGRQRPAQRRRAACKRAVQGSRPCTVPSPAATPTNKLAPSHVCRPVQAPQPGAASVASPAPSSHSPSQPAPA